MGEHLKMGEESLERGGPLLGELKESRPDQSVDTLRARMQEDGYLFLRGLLDAPAVLAAREQVLGFAHDHDHRVMGNRAITHHPTVLAVLESPALFDFFARLFGESVITTDYKWLRTMQRGGCSGAHYDFVYMGRGSQRLLTSWIPIGEIPARMGGLAILEDSHRCAGLARLRDTYGRMDVDRDRVQGWFSRDPLEMAEMSGTRWLTADYRPGDVLCFSLHTLHMSMTQDTDEIRTTCDVRWQPAADPTDERWFGERPVGHTAHASGETVAMSEAREQWGV